MSKSEIVISPHSYDKRMSRSERYIDDGLNNTDMIFSRIFLASENETSLET